MEKIKRARNSIIHDDDNSKRRKINVTTGEPNCLAKECTTIFEDLSNELIYEIFEFLRSHHAFQAFYNLNQRFQNLFVHTRLPIPTNISSISKSTFLCYLSHIIIPHAYQIKSIRFSNPFTTDMCLLLFPIMRNLTQLEALTLDNIQSDHIEQIVDHISFLPVLSSLTITCIDKIKNQSDIYYKIFRLHALNYCQMLLETSVNIRSLSIATNEFSGIEHLVINNKVSIDQLICLLSYVPYLRRLSIDHLDGFGFNRTQRNPIILKCLTNVSLKLHHVIFSELEQLVSDYFRQVQVFRIVVNPKGLPGSIREYLVANRWEQLISTYIPNLRVFDLIHKCHLLRTNDHRLVFESLINNFNSLFWVEHQWFFTYQYHPHLSTAVFYSINPYKRRDYMLHKELMKSMWSSGYDINEDPVHHVYLHNTETIKQFVGNFSDATELTLSGAFEVPRDSISTSLKLMIPLTQLTKLTLDCHKFPFEQLIELLQSTQNLHTLKLDSVLVYRTDFDTIQQNEIFQIACKTNTVTNMTIGEDMTLKKLQLLTALFPRMEYLTMKLCEKTFEPTARFLLAKSNSNTRYLSLLCISYIHTDFAIQLKNLIELEKLLHDYTMKVIDEKVYLWW